MPNLLALPRYRLTLIDFTICFVPFCILLGTALIAGETAEDPGFSRTVYTIWATVVFVTPALCTFTLPNPSVRQRTLWLLFWTFAAVVYSVHVYYAVYRAYHASWSEIIAGQGWFALVNNAIFTLWWWFDVLLAWCYTGQAKWARTQRIAAHWYIGLTFLASTVFLKRGFVNLLGVALAISVIVCLSIWLDMRRRRAELTPAA